MNTRIEILESLRPPVNRSPHQLLQVQSRQYLRRDWQYIRFCSHLFLLQASQRTWVVRTYPPRVYIMPDPTTPSNELSATFLCWLRRPQNRCKKDPEANHHKSNFWPSHRRVSFPWIGEKGPCSNRVPQDPGSKGHKPDHAKPKNAFHLYPLSSVTPKRSCNP